MTGFPPKARGNDNHLFCYFKTVSNLCGRIGIQNYFHSKSYRTKIINMYQSELSWGRKFLSNSN